jgi:hypothetical protein
MADASKKKKKKAPQAQVASFWSKFLCTPSKVHCIFPPSLYADLLPAHPTPTAGASSSRNAADSYEAAARECRARVARIVRECERTNEKFTDRDFDLEADFEGEAWNCLRGLVVPKSDAATAEESPAAAERGARQRRTARDGRAKKGVAEGPDDLRPLGVHRVDWIFEKPAFVVDGYSNADVKQGADGDCWWLAAVCTLCSVEGLVERVCVARDEGCGVYGFVFHRDGEWVWTVVDDSLYMCEADYTADAYDPGGERARRWREREQRGGDALYFAKSADENETWIPLMEKAYAKIHGDYDAIQGGWPGEGVEDLTGGVTVTLQCDRVFSKERLWRELVNEKGEFLFSVTTLPSRYYASSWKNSLATYHAYSLLAAVEAVGEDGKSHRLVKIRYVHSYRRRSGLTAQKPLGREELERKGRVGRALERRLARVDAVLDGQAEAHIWQ